MLPRVSRQAISHAALSWHEAFRMRSTLGAYMFASMAGMTHGETCGSRVMLPWQELGDKTTSGASQHTRTFRGKAKRTPSKRSQEATWTRTTDNVKSKKGSRAALQCKGSKLTIYSTSTTKQSPSTASTGKQCERLPRRSTGPASCRDAWLTGSEFP